MRRLWLVACAAASPAPRPPISSEVARLRLKRHYCEKRHKVVGPEPEKWLVFTKQRSGSRWFVDRVASWSDGTVHPHVHELGFQGIGFAPFDVPEHEYCIRAKASERCSCAVRRMFQDRWVRLQNGSQHPQKGALGFKFMVDGYDWETAATDHNDAYAFSASNPPAFDAFAASVCDLRIPFVIMLRKNALRREISHAAMGHVAAHYRVDEAAPRKTYKPTLNTQELEVRIAKEQLENEDLIAIFDYHCGGEINVTRRVHWYEDLVDASPRSSDEWARVLYELGAWPAPDAERARRAREAQKRAPLAIIHGSKPVNETIANFDEVRAVLTGSPHEWMLWD